MKAIIICFALIASADLAIAQEAAKIEIGGLYAVVRPYIADLLGLAILAAIGFATKFIKDKFGIDIEARHREALHSAAVTGLNTALSKFDVKAAGITVEVKNRLIAEAANYAIKAVPDAIKFFKLDEKRDDLKAIIEAKLQIALPDRPNA